MRFRFLVFLISSIILPAKCFAHVSERALILLLPTEFYIPAGISVLILTKNVKKAIAALHKEFKLS